YNELANSIHMPRTGFEVSAVEVDGATFWDYGERMNWEASCLDIYTGNGFSTTASCYNMVAVNPGGRSSPYGAGAILNTSEPSLKSYADNTQTKLSDKVIFIPADDSVLKGAGTYRASNPTDYF